MYSYDRRAGVDPFRATREIRNLYHLYSKAEGQEKSEVRSQLISELEKERDFALYSASFIEHQQEVFLEALKELRSLKEAARVKLPEDGSAKREKRIRAYETANSIMYDRAYNSPTARKLAKNYYDSERLSLPVPERIRAGELLLSQLQKDRSSLLELAQSYNEAIESLGRTMYSYDYRKEAYADSRAKINRRPATQFLNMMASEIAELGKTNKDAYPTLSNIAKRLEREGTDPMARKFWARKIAEVAGQLLQNSGNATRLWKELIEADITVQG